MKVVRAVSPQRVTFKQLRNGTAFRLFTDSDARLLMKVQHTKQDWRPMAADVESGEVFQLNDGEPVYPAEVEVKEL